MDERSNVLAGWSIRIGASEFRFNQHQYEDAIRFVAMATKHIAQGADSTDETIVVRKVYLYEAEIDADFDR